jgi:hypothetical protein
VEVTVDGEMTESEIEIPMLHWANKPWHMIEESVYKTCRHFLESLKAGARSRNLGPRQSEDLCGVRGGLRVRREPGVRLRPAA